MAAERLVPPPGQRGLAVLSVLLILVLLTTLAVYMADDENLAIRRIENQREAEQGFQVAIGAEQWAAKILERDLATAKKGEETDHAGEDWARLGPPVKVEDGSMQVAIVDEQGRFNLNNLLEGAPRGVPGEGEKKGAGKKVWFQAYRNLLLSLELPEQLGWVLVDWLDADNQESGPEGAEDYYYEGLDVPYRAANRQLKSVGELRLLKGYDEQVLAKLAPLVTALPVEKGKYAKINVNTAPPALLRALGSKKPLPADGVAALVAARTKAPFAKLQDFTDLFHKNISDPDAPLAGLADVKSDFFSAHGCAVFGRVQFGVRSLLFRDPEKRNVQVLNRERFFTCPQISSAK